MQIVLSAIGKLKAGPERELVARYEKRIVQTGRQIGISGFVITEQIESRAETAMLRKTQEAALLTDRLEPKTPLIAFDERGKAISSSDFSETLSRHLDDGVQQLTYVIGGPDGLDPSLRERARMVVSFGTMTMPHQLVRVLAVEQIYRATTLLLGHPYHRS